jgi:hypothetical protein
MRSVLLFIVPFLFSGFTATGIRNYAGWVSRTDDDLRRMLILAGSMAVFVLAPVAGLVLFASAIGGGSNETRAIVFLVWLVPDCIYVARNWRPLKERLARR